MAERKFDYENVGAVYKNMQNITGDESNADSIAGILHNIDEEFHNRVDVCEEAIFGDLGKQLLLDWDNTSSCFPNFVTNFSNWSTLIAQSAGNYAQFEQDIKGFNQDNPLGVTSGGITDAYTNTGFYRQYKNENYDSYVDALGLAKSLHMADLASVHYDVTDSQALLTRHKVITSLMLAGDVASLLLIGGAAYGSLGGGTTELAPIKPQVTPGGTPMLGNGQAFSLEELSLTHGGNAKAMEFLNYAKSMGAKTIASNGAEVQLLDESGKVLYTFYNSASAATASGTAAASSSTGILDGILNSLKSGASSVANFFKGAGGTVASGASKAGNTVGAFVKSHPVATSVVASTAVNSAINNFQN